MKRNVQDKLALNGEKVIQLVDPRCPKCGLDLIKWGINPRKMILDRGHVPNIRGVQRYRCKNHGEIKIDLSEFIPARQQYAENWRRRACQLMFDGLTPPAVRRAFLKCFGISPSESSIRNWAVTAADAAGKIIHDTSVPTSGYYGYDEIYINLRGNWVFVQTIIDLETGFCPDIGYTIELSDKPTTKLLLGVHQNKSSKIEGIVWDGAAMYYQVQRRPEFADINIQLCQTHYKKNLNEKIYMASGLGKRRSEPLPEPYDQVKRLLFAPFNRSTRIKAEFSLAYADANLRGKVSKDVDQILDGMAKSAD